MEHSFKIHLSTFDHDDCFEDDCDLVLIGAGLWISSCWFSQSTQKSQRICSSNFKES